MVKFNRLHVSRKTTLNNTKNPDFSTTAVILRRVSYLFGKYMRLTASDRNTFFHSDTKDQIIFGLGFSSLGFFSLGFFSLGFLQSRIFGIP